jgi:hypothetical protein
MDKPIDSWNSDPRIDGKDHLEPKCPNQAFFQFSGQRLKGEFREMRKKPQTRDENYLDLTNLIRSIQRSEGYCDCFRKKAGHCEQMD